jgi:formate-dependent nitrite reductase membrane component NrfD
VNNLGETGDAGRGYYGLPVLKLPVWHWEIWMYFFLGGIAAGSYLLASLAAVFGDGADRRASRVGFVISVGALVACPPLLIKDLGRPERFLNMLRIVKPGSPMSLGIWALLGFSACAVATAFRECSSATSGVGKIARFALPIGPLLVLGSALATFIAGYTGVLLSVTSVPLWSRSRMLGPAFFASSLASGAAAMVLGLATRGDRSPATRHKLERVKLIAATVEGIALVGFIRQTGFATSPLLDSRRHGRAFLLGAVGLGVVLPVLGGAANRRGGPAVALFLAVCSLVGGIFLRYAIVAGGRASAEDPEATFRHTDKPL